MTEKMATVSVRKGGMPSLYNIFSDVHSSVPGKLEYMGQVEKVRQPRRPFAHWVCRLPGGEVKAYQPTRADAISTLCS